MMTFVNEDDSVNWNELQLALEMATYMGYIVSLPELDLYEWNNIDKGDRILGVSMTGLQDFFNKTKMNEEDKIELMKFARAVTHEENKKLAHKYNETEASLITTAQPSGNSSVMLDSVSAGVHWSHSPYYIRRVRIGKNDPVAKSLIDSGFNWSPEVGQTEDKHTTKVFEFPVKAPDGKTKYDVSAIEQLEMYKMMMENYVDHNVSITVHVREHEWELVEEWMWENWDVYVGISFMSLDDSFYDLLPYEAITEVEYNKMLEDIPVFDPISISKYETGEDLDISDVSSCDSGICPIR